MDVKKYMGYLPLCMLSIIIVFSLLVYSKRNDFAIGLSTVAAQEHKSIVLYIIHYNRILHVIVDRLKLK